MVVGVGGGARGWWLSTVVVAAAWGAVVVVRGVGGGDVDGGSGCVVVVGSGGVSWCGVTVAVGMTAVGTPSGISMRCDFGGCYNLMYAMTSTRPDIAYVVGRLSRGGAISWASKKQTCITGSTMEYEFVALVVAGEWNIKQCKRKICDGNYTMTVRVLSSSCIAPYNDATLKDLNSRTGLIVVLEARLVDEMEKCPKILGEYIASAPLTLLVKSGSGIRPIAVVTVWRHLVSKVSVVMIGHSLDGNLDDMQFGVGGDPLGPLLFALVLHPLICKIRDPFSLFLHAWYLDNGTIVGDTLVVGKVLGLIIEDGPRCGLYLNIDKTESILSLLLDLGLVIGDGDLPPYLFRLGGLVSIQQ
nr:protein RIC1 [Tanacetum cinerariifolium]